MFSTKTILSIIVLSEYVYALIEKVPWKKKTQNAYAPSTPYLIKVSLKSEDRFDIELAQVYNPTFVIKHIYTLNTPCSYSYTLLFACKFDFFTCSFLKKTSVIVPH